MAEPGLSNQVPYLDSQSLYYKTGQSQVTAEPRLRESRFLTPIQRASLPPYHYHHYPQLISPLKIFKTKVDSLVEVMLKR